MHGESEPLAAARTVMACARVFTSGGFPASTGWMAGRRAASLGFVAVGLALVAGCSGGGVGIGPAGGNFVLLRTEPSNNGRLFLNDPIAFDFSNPVDLGTANLNTVAFDVFDVGGIAVAEQPVGSFRLARSPGDAEIGRRLEFVPRFPTNNTYTDGGFRPNRTYSIQLVGGSGRNGNVLKDAGGRGLEVPASFRVSTAIGSTPNELFRDTQGGGPRRTGFAAMPTSSRNGDPGTVLNKSGQELVQVVLQFNQPLNPHSANVPVALNPNPLLRSTGQRGRIFLEYDDPDPAVGIDTWIPALVELTSNTLLGSEVRLFPIGVLPSNATIRVIVENTVEDISGESNAADPSFNREFAQFDTVAALEPQFDAIVASFDGRGVQADLDAPFLEPPAELGNGFIRASFGFEGSETTLDYEPNTRDVVLNTNLTQITPRGSPSFNVSGGVFEFRNVRIPLGVTVRGAGTNPMVWRVLEDFVVEGTLTVRGGDGAWVNSLRSANIATGGGTAVCGGGAGGRGSPNTSGQSPRGEPGFGPGQTRGGGGQGGRLSATRVCNRGSGGGGGSFGEAGDPYYPVKSVPTANTFRQQLGVGGPGCTGASGAASRTLAGGSAGPVEFRDPRDDNDFWGPGVDVQRLIRVTGELEMPRGGAGGGGGGDRATQAGGTNWIANNKGGGGGAGGGILIIDALGTIRIGPEGLINAEGGHGGGGEPTGSNREGGGGGGGSGGMIVLRAGTGIEIAQHGDTFAGGDYTFALSADGGVGTQNSFEAWSSKYPPPENTTAWDNGPSGGFGGLGLVQLMAPAGDNSDGTNTVLDDNIHVLDSAGARVDAQTKMDYLAWRGFPRGSGQWVDDSNSPTYANLRPDDEGDIRPAPILLPGPFSSRSRWRSRWVDTGRSIRRPLTSGARGVRSIAENLAAGLLAGPAYTFAGTNAEQDPTAERYNWRGYIDYTQTPSGVGLLAPEVLQSPALVASVVDRATFEGGPAYQVTLRRPVLGSIVDRYSQYQARLIDASGFVVGEYRILGHGARTAYLSPEQGPLPTKLGGLTMQIVAKFFAVRTAQAPGLGLTHVRVIRLPNGEQRSVRVPTANIRIGFAFHKNPTAQSPTEGVDLDRLPQQVGDYLYDLADPGVQETVRTFAGDPGLNRGPGAPFVMMDVLFNTRFSEEQPNNTAPAGKNPLSPSSPRPELRFLVLPYRF